MFSVTLDAPVHEVRVFRAAGREGWTVLVNAIIPATRTRPQVMCSFIEQYGTGLGADVFAANDAENIRQARRVRVQGDYAAVLHAEDFQVWQHCRLSPLWATSCTCHMQPERCAEHASAREAVAA